MSCADGVSPCSGGRRSTHFDASSPTRNVRLDRPPEISSARSSPLRGMPDLLEVAVQGVEVEPFQRSQSPDLSTTADFAAAGPIRVRCR